MKPKRRGGSPREMFTTDPRVTPVPNHMLNVSPVTLVPVMNGAHVHSHVEINLILDGEMTYLFNGRPVSLKKGELGLFWAAFPHRTISVAPSTYFIVSDLPIEAFMAIAASDAFKAAIMKGGFLTANRVFPHDEALFRLWHEDVRAKDDRATGLVRDELSNRLRRLDMDGWRDLAHEHDTAEPSAKREETQRDKVHRMARFIAEHASEAIAVIDVADAVGLHPNYAMTLFRKTLGMTINEYVNRQRLMLAHSMLLASDRDIAAIAFDAGFGSLSRFYEAFKARYGCAPRDMRRRFHENRSAAVG